MKDINKIKDYRLKYKRYYGIDFDSSYDVHHIDFDRSNNEIDNLLLLPKELHAKYHMALNKLKWIKHYNGLTTCRYNTTHTAEDLEDLSEALKKIHYWVLKKEICDMEIMQRTKR